MLDHRKDEAVERTFKGVAKSFRDIFAQVRHGRVPALESVHVRMCVCVRACMRACVRACMHARARAPMCGSALAGTLS